MTGMGNVVVTSLDTQRAVNVRPRLEPVAAHPKGLCTLAGAVVRFVSTSWHT